MDGDLLLIRRDVAQAIMDYLATRPAGEVLQFMLALRALQPASHATGTEPG